MIIKITKKKKLPFVAIFDCISLFSPFISMELFEIADDFFTGCSPLFHYEEPTEEEKKASERTIQETRTTLRFVTLINGMVNDKLVFANNFNQMEFMYIILSKRGTLEAHAYLLRFLECARFYRGKK